MVKGSRFFSVFRELGKDGMSWRWCCWCMDGQLFAALNGREFGGLLSGGCCLGLLHLYGMNWSCSYSLLDNMDSLSLCISFIIARGDIDTGVSPEHCAENSGR